MKLDKNFKRSLIIFSIFLTLFLIIGSISASEYNTENVSLDSSDDIGGTDYEITADGSILNEYEMDGLGISNNEMLSDENYTNDNNTYENTTITNNTTGNISEIPDAPKITKLQYYPKNNDYYAKFCWISINGSTYEVLRNSTDEFEVIATVTANSNEMAYYDKITNNCSYTYSVREIKENNETIYGLYDVEGLKLIPSPEANVDFQNLMANVTWNRIDDATNYRIFRKMGRDGQFKCIAVVDANESNYVDYYYNSAKELSSILNKNIFADPSFNNLFYTVRACSIQSVNGTTKTDYGLYLKDGDFNLESPAIVSLEDNIIKWGKVPNADGYYILKKNDSNNSWEIIGQANQKSSTTISMSLENTDMNAYYSVQAFAVKNGEIVYSRYDNGFSLMNYSQENSEYRILYFGDSITYGSPYKSASSRHIFSIPYRVGQLLGCVYYNPSIPGSTYHDLGQINGTNILNSNYYRYRICREVVDPIFSGELPGNWEDLDNSQNSEGMTNTSIDDYNIVVLAAGTNDYLDNSELGPQDSNDTKTFNGAFNYIIEKIDEASQMRVERGEAPIKVILEDLYYSDRAYNIKIRQNRDLTKNKIGLTLLDYQNALNEQYTKWQNKSEYLTFYNFKTRSYDIVNEENCPYTASDNLHYTKYTYGQYGNSFARYISENIFKDKLTTNLSVEDLTMAFNDGSSLNITLTYLKSTPISGAKIKVNNSVKTLKYTTDDNGAVSIPITFKPGEYNFTISFDGNDIYEACKVTVKVIVNKIETVLQASDLNITYNDGNITARLTDSNGNAISGVTIEVYNSVKTLKYRTDSEGCMTAPVSLKPGQYNYSLTYKGNSKYGACNITVKVIVNKIGTVLEASDLNITYNDGNITARLTDTNGNPISGVTIEVYNSIKTLKYHSNEEGYITAPVSIKPGEYNYTLTYKGNNIYSAAKITKTLTINKLTTILDASDLNITYNNGNITARLTDSNGNAISKVTIEVYNGLKTLKYHTDSNGFITAPLSLKPGEYNYTLNFKGNGIYNAAKITKALTVNRIATVLESSDLNVTYNNGNLTARLTDSSGNAISGVTIKFNNTISVYRYRTDSEGIATAPIKAKPGEYSYTMSFDGNSFYLPSSVTKTVVVQ